MSRRRPIPFLLATAGLLSLYPFALGGGAAHGQSDAVVATPSGKTVDARVWPRPYKVDGIEFSLYQPQVDSWSGDVIKARQVMAVTTGQTKGADGKPAAGAVYGVLWLSAKTGTDKTARTVTLDDIVVEKASFPSAPDKEATYQAAAKKALPTTQLVASLDAIEAQLAIAGEEQKADNVAVSNKAPEIIVSLQPAMLVLIDGDPVWRASGVSGVERVLNTSAPILRYQGKLYLGHAGKWMTAPSLDGSWAAIAQVPSPVSQALDQLLKQGGNASQQPAKSTESDDIKTVYVRTHPAELISIEGQPTFADVAGTSLSYVTNTPADLFLEGANSWYVLISGRWFTATSTNGPWSFVAADKLPADFLKIDSSGPKGSVLASIAGTPEAKEALVANSVPQTATVQRKDADFKATYDGSPQFVAIDGTSIKAAKNSPAPVFEVSANNYVALSNGVWFVATAATGPWQVATEVPAVIYGIPATSQYHYVTYVKIYGSTPDVVYVGYTPGYYGTVVNNNVVVYGTGYTCNAWVGAYYYGCPTTYGYGASFAFGAAVGWSLAFGFGWYDPWYGPYWGPWYYPGYYPGYWPGYWGGGAYAWGDVYGRWGNSVVAGRGAAWYNPYTGNVGRAGRGGYYNEATGGRGWGYAGRNTNIYTGNTAAAAGGIRYNPQTGRVVAGHGGAAGNIYTGDGAAAGARTVVNTNTGRVTREAGGAARSASGATAAGGFNTAGAGGDAKGAGYVHYDRATGDVTHGGAVDVNGNIYAGKDGNVYRYDPGNGWQSANGNRIGGSGGTQKVGPVDNSLDRQRAARDRGFERDTMAGRGFERQGAQRPAFDRSSFGGGFQGRMGGFRGGRFGHR